MDATTKAECYPALAARKALASTLHGDEVEAFARNVERAQPGAGHAIRMVGMNEEERRRYRAARNAGLL